MSFQAQAGVGLGVPGVDDLFGAWQAPARVASFAVGDAGAPPQPAWQPRLPASAAEANAALTAQEQVLQRAVENLSKAQERLETLAATVQAQPPGQSAVAFAVPGGPESDLLAAINNLQGAGQGQTAVAFSLFGGDEPDGQKDALGQWQDLLQRVRDIVSNYALINTAPGGALVSRTAVDWSGDFHTTWEDGITDEWMRVHQKNVRVALASRRALVRLVVVVGTGAAGLVARLSVPGAQLLLLPYVWKFVRDVLKEIKEVNKG